MNNSAIITPENLRRWRGYIETILTWATPNLDWFITTCRKFVDNYVDKQYGRPLLVGILGKAGSGKDSALDFLKAYGVIRKKLAFADPIREIGKVFGFTMEQMSDRKLKESTDEFWGISPRVFMQKVGTEMFRDQWRQDVWVELARKKIRTWDTGVDGKTIFLTDVRFPNEAEMIREEGGILVKVERPDNPTPSMNHASEIHIDEIKPNTVIRNTYMDAATWSVAFTKCLFQALDPNLFHYGLK